MIVSTKLYGIVYQQRWLVKMWKRPSKNSSLPELYFPRYLIVRYLTNWDRVCNIATLFMGMGPAYGTFTNDKHESSVEDIAD